MTSEPETRCPLMRGDNHDCAQTHCWDYHALQMTGNERKAVTTTGRHILKKLADGGFLRKEGMYRLTTKEGASEVHQVSAVRRLMELGFLAEDHTITRKGRLVVA